MKPDRCPASSLSHAGGGAICRFHTPSRKGDALIVCLLAALSLCACTSLGQPSNGFNSSANTGFDQTQTVAPTEAVFLHIDNANSAYQQAQWDQATTFYEQALSQMPDDPYLWFRLGNSLTQQGDYSRAIRAFENSLRHDAQQSKSWFNLSTVYLLGAQLASLKAWQAMAANDPSRAVAQQRLNSLSQLLR